MKQKIKSKPVIFESIQWTNDNFDEVEEFCGYGKAKINYEAFRVLLGVEYPILQIITPIGWVSVPENGYVVKHPDGVLNSVGESMFEQLYEVVDG